MSSNTTPLGITLPDTMPVAVAAMLQTGIAQAWTDYPGDQNDPEAFWTFLTST